MGSLGVAGEFAYPARRRFHTEYLAVSQKEKKITIRHIYVILGEPFLSFLVLLQ